jgi:hypothetical protein
MQPPEPSSVEPSTDAQAAPEPVSEPSPPASNFLQRLFRRRGSEEPEPTESEGSPPTSAAITLTQEELDRRIQAETDRREYKRSQDTQAAERRRLRDEDPWAYAEQDRMAEQQQEQGSNVMAQVGQIEATYDRFALDPLVMQLPEAERQRILKLEGAGVGLEGRKLIVSEGLRALEKHWKAEAEKEAQDKLRRNPAFRKQVLNEIRRGGLVEPDFVSSGPPSAADKTMSDMLRSQIRARHT